VTLLDFATPYDTKGDNDFLPVDDVSLPERKKQIDFTTGVPKLVQPIAFDTKTLGRKLSEVDFLPKIRDGSSRPNLELKTELAPLELCDSRSSVSTLDSSWANVLCRMFNSRCRSQEREAAFTLSQLSQDSANQKFLLHFRFGPQPFLELLAVLLESSDCEVRRCATTIAANLSKRDEAGTEILKHLLSKLTQLVGMEDRELTDRNTKRQAALALSTLSLTHAASMRAIETTLERQRDAPDAKLRVYVNATLSRVSVA
jgi:hypothetical protein